LLHASARTTVAPSCARTNKMVLIKKIVAVEERMFWETQNFDFVQI